MATTEQRTGLALSVQQRIVEDTNGCWVWQGTRHEQGYGTVHIRGKPEFTHRLMYQLFVGPIHHWQEIDHLCRNRLCCNPAHLEAVSSRENSMRGNHPLFTAHRERRCQKGHDLTIEENVAYRSDGRTRCRICLRDYQRRADAKRRGKEGA